MLMLLLVLLLLSWLPGDGLSHPRYCPALPLLIGVPLSLLVLVVAVSASSWDVGILA